MTGRSRELTAALKTRCIDIACVQETKWSRGKAKETGEGYKLYYNGETKTQNGVGIAIAAKLKGSVVTVNRLCDRLIEIDSGKTTLRVVCCYAPQVRCSDESKDEFWVQLKDHLCSVQPEECLVIGGDLNGHVGPEEMAMNNTMVDKDRVCETKKAAESWILPKPTTSS